MVKAREQFAPATNHAEQQPESVLGDNLKRLRTAKGLSLVELSKRTHIAHSSLWKVEKHQMSLTFDKLAQLASGLGVGVDELFRAQELRQASGRLAVTASRAGALQETGRCLYEYPCTALRNRQMTPMITQLHADTMASFGEWSRHDGEEYVYVLRGPVRFESEFYQPIELQTGDSLYYDSSMGHAFLRVEGGEATILSVCVGKEHGQPLSTTKATPGSKQRSARAVNRKGS
jgi:transcriptional regulator with XRE-family HTH domain